MKTPAEYLTMAYSNVYNQHTLWDGCDAEFTAYMNFMKIVDRMKYFNMYTLDCEKRKQLMYKEFTVESLEGNYNHEQLLAMAGRVNASETYRVVDEYVDCGLLNLIKVEHSKTSVKKNNQFTKHQLVTPPDEVKLKMIKTYEEYHVLILATKTSAELNTCITGMIREVSLLQAGYVSSVTIFAGDSFDTRFSLWKAVMKYCEDSVVLLTKSMDYKKQ